MVKFSALAFAHVCLARSWMVVHGQDTQTVLSAEAGTLSIDEDAYYTCTFTNQWSGVRHPTQYPDNAHWSPPIIASHSTNYQMWAPGELASEGIENLAETGSLDPLTTLLEDSDEVEDFVNGVVTFNREVQQQVISAVKVSADFPLLSSASMIAPSPDWFSGFHEFDARSLEDTWYSSFSIQTFPWDAGTEMGETYSIENDAEDPHVDISQITVDSAPMTGALLNSEMNEVLPVATWTCELDQPSTGSFDCFSATNYVYEESKGKTQINELQVGEKVLTGSGKYKTVYTIDHAHPTKRTKFVQIHSSSPKDDEVQSAEPLELTPAHMVFVLVNNEKAAIPAWKVKVGNYIQAIDGAYGSTDFRIVTRISSVYREGIYNPITEDGTIVVNDVVASTYSVHFGGTQYHFENADVGSKSSTSGSKYVGIGGGKFQLISHHDFYHLALAPYRFLCIHVSPSTCDNSRSTNFMLSSNKNHDNKISSDVDEEYIGDYSKVGLAILKFGLNQNQLVQDTMILGMVAVFGLIHFVLTSPLAATAMVLVWIVIVRRCQKNEITKG